MQPAVVAREDDDRPVAKTGRIQMREQAADAVVERLYGCRICRIERFAVRLDGRGPRGTKRDVRVVVREVEKERAVAVGIDEALGLPGQVVLPLAPFEIAR